MEWFGKEELRIGSKSPSEIVMSATRTFNTNSVWLDFVVIFGGIDVLRNCGCSRCESSMVLDSVRGRPRWVGYITITARSLYKGSPCPDKLTKSLFGSARVGFLSASLRAWETTARFVLGDPR